MNASSVDTAVS